MVRFRVIRGSRLLLGVAVVALALVVCLLALRFFSNSGDGAVLTGGSLVEENTQEEAETALAVFASSVQSPDIEITVLEPDAQGQAPQDGENEHTDRAVAPLELSPDAEPLAAAVDTPRILIYHTHTHEAYEQAADDPYVAVEAWRTTDEEHSVVRVGAELARLLREHGCEVVHDTTDHELDELSTAYARSLQTLESYHVTFDLYIDLHRDAYVEGSGPAAVSFDGEEYARLMLLIGKGESFAQKPNYSENYAFACALTERLNQRMSGICRDVLVKTNRYNQHIGVYAVLIEVGNNRNTLVEALNSMEPLADALAAMLVVPRI